MNLGKCTLNPFKLAVNWDVLAFFYFYGTDLENILYSPLKNENTMSFLEQTMSFLNDEPAKQDLLDRKQYTDAFAKFIFNCDTPMTIGIHGPWGIGKTSFMNHIKDGLSKEVLPVWFNSWEHQCDENPAVSMLYALCQASGVHDNDVKGAFSEVFSLFSHSVLKRMLNLGVDDILKIKKINNDFSLELIKAQNNLRAKYELVIASSLKQIKAQRICFFIDDLDRCIPERVVKVLESIKLFLNLNRCVFVLGADVEQVSKSIENYYGNEYSASARYLEKIIQVPFAIPPIRNDKSVDYLTSLLPEDAGECSELALPVLGDNPRTIKRFVNIFRLYHEMAKAIVKGYQAQLLCACLLVQQISPELYSELVGGDFLGVEDESTIQIGGISVSESWIDKMEEYNLDTIFKKWIFPNDNNVTNYIYLIAPTSSEDPVSKLKMKTKIRVEDIAAAFSVSSQFLIHLCKSIGIQAKSQKTVIGNSELDRIKLELENMVPAQGELPSKMTL